jgi:hypothetical protein
MCIQLNSWEIMEERLKAAFSEVETTEPPADRMGIRSAIPELARYFLKETHNKYANPRLAIVTEKAAVWQILEIAKHSTALLTALEQMSGAAENAFDPLNRAFFSKLMTQLRLLDVTSRFADPPKLPPNSGTGRPKDTYAQRAADVTARYYWLLSGKTPTVIKPNKKGDITYSEYLYLLEKVFSILGLKDNKPATYATDAVKRWPELLQQAKREFGWVDPDKEKKQP